MALPFLGKKAVTGKGYSPTDRIRDLASKGFSEPEIIDILRKEGFSPEEVDKGLTQALKISVSPEAPSVIEPRETFESHLPELPTAEGLGLPGSERLEVPETSLPHGYPAGYSTEEYIDYLVSQRITEQLTDFYYRMQEISDKYNELTEKLNEIKVTLTQSEKIKEKEQQEISGKLEEFKGAINDVGLKIASLERAFKDTVPSLIESVRTLADLIESHREEHKGE